MKGVGAKGKGGLGEAGGRAKGVGGRGRGGSISKRGKGVTTVTERVDRSNRPARVAFLWA